MRLDVAALCAALAWAAPAVAEQRAIDIQRSTITIHVGKAGLLSLAAHEHWISAPIASGAIDATDPASVEFKVQSASMRVKPDPKVDAKTHHEIQKDMEEMTLETRRYPEITFRSTRVEKITGQRLVVYGTLTLHGAAEPVVVNVIRDKESYTGHVVIKQTDFGIKPISIGGGMIKIKDAVDIDFEIFPR